MPWTYIAQCRDGTYYVGSTYDLARRISEHDLGFGAAYTRPRRRRPVKLVWSAEFDRMDQAYWYEKQVQGWSREKRQALIEGRWDDLPELARNRQTDESSAVCVAGRGICECQTCGGISTGSMSGG